jgi:hypothetical protein
MPSRTLASIILVTAALVPSAHAERPAPFAIMDDTGDPSKFDGDFAFGFDRGVDGDNDDSVVSRFELRWQYVARVGIGGYVAIPAGSEHFVDGKDPGDALGNLQLGGLFQRQLSSDLDLGVSAGLALPTAPDPSTRLGRTNLTSTLAMRPADYATAIGDATLLRASLSPTYQRGDLYLRVDGGVDVPLDSTETGDLDALAHVNLGVGAILGKVSASAELQTLAMLAADGDEWLHTAAVSLRYWGRRLSPLLAVSSPLDDRLRGEIVTVTLGVSAYD